MEFDWGDDEEKPKKRKHKAIYSDSPQVKENAPALNEINNMGLQADILISLMGANFNYKREEH